MGAAAAYTDDNNMKSVIHNVTTQQQLASNENITE